MKASRSAACTHWARCTSPDDLLSCSITLDPAALYMQAYAVIMWSNSPSAAVSSSLPAVFKQLRRPTAEAIHALTLGHFLPVVGALAGAGSVDIVQPSRSAYDQLVSKLKCYTGSHAAAALQG